jgi:glutamate--cysteine ligase
LIGAELEWLTAWRGGDRSGRGPDRAGRVDLDSLAAALGPYAPNSLAPAAQARPLPRGGRVTMDPGGQIEISSSARESVQRLCSDLRADTETLRRLLKAGGIRIVPVSADTRRSPERLLTSPRYRAMEASFACHGPFGKLMMCNTAATQVSVDAGADPAEISARWTALYAVGPALVAAFACSPRLCGAPPGAWASQRMRTWLHLDVSRTTVGSWSDPIAGYASWALDVPLLCVRGAADWDVPREASFADWLGGGLDDVLDRRPDHSDLEYHLTTVFPPVRAAGHLEVRYLDAQPADSWSVPIHVIGALMSSPAVVAEATGLARSTAGRWHDAARVGLDDSEIRAAAGALLELAAEHAGSAAARAALAAAATRCLRGVAPHAQEVAA